MARLLGDHPAVSGDVVFNVSGRQFRAHKAVLAARSPLFASLFQPEARRPPLRIDVADVDAVVFDRLLRFIYTGDTVGVDDVAERMLTAATQYKLTDLKSVCQVNTITIQLMPLLTLISI